MQSGRLIRQTVEKRISFRVMVLVLFHVVATLGGSAAIAGCSRPLNVAFYDWNRQSAPIVEQAEFRLDRDLVGYIFAAAGCQLVETTQPIKRVLAGIRAGRIDALAGASRTPEREAYGTFSLPYRDEQIVMFMHKATVGTLPIKTVEQLVPYKVKIGVSLGAWYGPAFQRLVAPGSGFRGMLLPTDESTLLFNLLIQRRADIILSDLYYGQFFLRQQGLEDEIVHHPVPVHQDRVHLLFSKTALEPEDVAVIDAAIKTSIQRAEYQAILARYEGIGPAD